MAEPAKQTTGTTDADTPADRESWKQAGVSIALHERYDFRGDEFTELYAASAATAFQHPVWLDAFFRHLTAARHAEPILVEGRDDDGNLVFFVPLIRRRMSGITLLESADLGVSDYAAPIVRRSWFNTVGDSDHVQRILSDALPPHDILRIKPVREESRSVWKFLLPGTPERLDFSAHAVRVGAPYEAWREEALSRSFRKYLDRRKKRFLKTGDAGLRLIEEPGEIRYAIETLRDLRSGRFEGDIIQQDFACAFYADVAIAGASAGFARTYGLNLDGQDIGYVFGLTDRGRFNYLLIGCDYDNHGRHSPGLLMYDMIIADWISSGGDLFDFTIGDEPFKADFGTTPTPVYALRAARTWRGKLALAGFEGRDRIREWLKPLSATTD